MELVIEYYLEDELKTFNSDLNRKISDGDENLSFLCESSDDGLLLTIYPKRELIFKDIYVNYDLNIKENEKIFFNGYLDSSYSYEVGVNEFDDISDNIFKKYFSNKKELVGFSYLYIRDDDKYRLFASLNEDFAFTKFTYQKDLGLIFSSDINSYKTTNSFVALNLCFISGTENEVFDKYFELLDISKPRLNSLYSYVIKDNNFDEELLINKNKYIDTVLIDVTDYLDNDDLLDNDFKNIIDKIHDSGYKIGLCLKPFYVKENSNFYLKHKDWLVFAEEGIYILDIYNDEFRDYLKNLLNKWDFDVYKFTCLDNICLLNEYYNKPKAKVMKDALNLLKELINEKIMIVKDVPLASCFGLVDASYVTPSFDFNENAASLLTDLGLKQNSFNNILLNLIYRRQLNKRAFCNVSDCSIFENDNKCEKLLLLNKFFASSCLISGNLEIDSLFDNEFTKISFENKFVEIDYKDKDNDKSIKIKL